MGLPKCVTGRPMWRRTEPNKGPHLDPPVLTRWHTLCPHISLSSHTHTYQHKHHTHRKFLLVPLFPPPLHIHTQGNGISCRDVIFISLSLDHSHFSCYRSHAPPSAPPRPHQMHQLHIHTCYITYPIDLKSPLFTFISHTTFLLNKVWPKNYFRVSTYIQHYKVIWRSTNANLHCMVPTMIFIPHCEFVYFYTIYKVSHNKEKRRASLSPSHTPCTPLSRMHTKLSPGPLKVSPQ